MVDSNAEGPRVYSAKEFAWEMRRTKPSSWTRNPAMMAHAERLSRAFSNPSLKAVMSDRQGFGDFAEYTSATNGLESALDMLEDYERAGLPANIQAVVTTRVSRNADQFSLAASLMRRIYSRTDRDPYVGHFYASSLAAVGRLEELKEVALEASDSIIAENSQQTRARWAETLVDMLILDVAEEIAESLDKSSPARRTLDTRIASFKNPAGQIGEFMPTIMINLESERRKYQLAKRILEGSGHRVSRFDAVVGARLPEVTLRSLCGSDQVRRLMSPGSVAASLSHFKVWETFLESPDEMCLVVEDDAGPFVHSSHLAQLCNRMRDTDILYVNERMSQLATGQEPDSSSDVMKPWDQVSGWQPGRQGWGFDGYILTRPGAEKAVELAGRLGIKGHVDGQFGAYSTAPDGQPMNGIQKNILSFRRELRDGDNLVGRCARLPGIKANTFGVSSTVTAGMR